MRKPSVLAAIVGAALVSTGVAGAAGELFHPQQTIPLEQDALPLAVTIGDATNDGRPDVVLTTGIADHPSFEYRFWIYAQNADGGLAAPTSVDHQPGDAVSVAIGELSGDGLSDIVLGIRDVGVQVWPQIPPEFVVWPFPYEISDAQLIRLGHLNDDALLDVAAVGFGTNTVSVLLNGDGSLLPPVEYPADHGGFEDLEVADVTGDGLDDLIVMSGQLFAAPNINVLPQLESGGFGSAVEYNVAPGVLTNGIGVGDVTGDGRNDVVASYEGIAVFAQTPEGTLAAPAIYGTANGPRAVEIADVNLDSKADVVVAHVGSNAIGVYLQQSNGTLAPEDEYEIPVPNVGPHGLAVGDISGDGAPDLVIADRSHGLVILYNAVPDSTEPETTSPSAAGDPGANTVPAYSLRRCYEELRPICLRLIKPR